MKTKFDRNITDFSYINLTTSLNSILILALIIRFGDDEIWLHFSVGHVFSFSLKVFVKTVTKNF